MTRPDRVMDAIESEVWIDAPPETVFLRRAKAAGCRTQNGEQMLLEQAYHQFKLFTGLDYPEDCRGKQVF